MDRKVGLLSAFDRQVCLFLVHGGAERKRRLPTVYAVLKENEEKAEADRCSGPFHSLYRGESEKEKKDRSLLPNASEMERLYHEATGTLHLKLQYN